MRKRIYYSLAVFVTLLISATFVEATVITSLPYTISTRGYYTINANLTSSGHGIIVNSNNVTIDLGGYTIAGKGTGSSYHGIYMNGRNNVEIRNGTVRGFSGRGIYEAGFTGDSHRIINVKVVGNKNVGIYLLSSSNMVKNCTVSKNGGQGIHTNMGSLVSENIAYDNEASGITAGSGSTISGNTAFHNGFSGISAGSGCTVKNNTTFYNMTYGIGLGEYNLVDGNTAYNNDQLLLHYPNFSPCDTCIFGVNLAPLP